MAASYHLSTWPRVIGQLKSAGHFSLDQYNPASAGRWEEEEDGQDLDEAEDKFVLPSTAPSSTSMAPDVAPWCHLVTYHMCTAPQNWHCSKSTTTLRVPGKRNASPIGLAGLGWAELRAALLASAMHRGLQLINRTGSPCALSASHNLDRGQTDSDIAWAGKLEYGVWLRTTAHGAGVMQGCDPCNHAGDHSIPISDPSPGPLSVQGGGGQPALIAGGRLDPSQSAGISFEWTTLTSPSLWSDNRVAVLLLVLPRSTHGGARPTSLPASHRRACHLYYAVLGRAWPFGSLAARDGLIEGPRRRSSELMQCAPKANEGGGAAADQP